MILNSKDPRENGKRLQVDPSSEGCSIEIQNAYGPGECITLDVKQTILLLHYLQGVLADPVKLNPNGWSTLLEVALTLCNK